jgi:acetyltransferase-like isoleucine patch superfamily enzyme
MLATFNRGSDKKMFHIGENVQMGQNVEIDFGAYVGDETVIGNNVKIGSHSLILPGSVVRDNCIIGGHCIIGHPTKIGLQKVDFSATSPKIRDLIVKDSETRIGENSIIRSGSTVYKHVVIGKRLRTGHNILVREHTRIGDNCVVGTQAVLDGYIVVGNKSMIQSQCYIAQSVRIGSGVFIAPGCMFFDNKKIVLGEGLNGATVEDYVRIGGGAKILSGITIGKYALIGAGSVVTRSIMSKAIVHGAPAEVKGFQKDKEIKKYVNSIKNWE